MSGVLLLLLLLQPPRSSPRERSPGGRGGPAPLLLCRLHQGTGEHQGATEGALDSRGGLQVSGGCTQKNYWELIGRDECDIMKKILYQTIWQVNN